MTDDRTQDLLDLLYGECSPDEAAELRRAIEEDEGLAGQWRELVADKEAVNQAMSAPRVRHEALRASILEKASRQAAAQREASKGGLPTLPWRSLSVAAMALLTAGVAWILLSDPGSPEVVESPAEPAQELAMEQEMPEVAEPVADEAPAIAETEEQVEVAADDEDATSPLDRDSLATSEEAVARAQEEAEEQVEETHQELLALRSERAREAPARSAPSPRPESEPPAEAESNFDTMAEADDLMGDGAIGRAAPLAQDQAPPQAEAEIEDEAPPGSERLAAIEQLLDDGDEDEARQRLQRLLDSEDADALDADERQRAEELLQRLEGASP